MRFTKLIKSEIENFSPKTPSISNEELAKKIVEKDHMDFLHWVHYFNKKQKNKELSDLIYKYACEQIDDLIKKEYYLNLLLPKLNILNYYFPNKRKLQKALILSLMSYKLYYDAYKLYKKFSLDKLKREDIYLKKIREKFADLGLK